MEATELCVCKETAIHLKDKGFLQEKSYFVWQQDVNIPSKYNLILRSNIEFVDIPIQEGGSIRSYDFLETIDAPTVSELLNSPEIPDDTSITKHIDATGTKYEVFSLSNNIDDIGEEILVEAVAEYWLKVKEIP